MSLKKEYLSITDSNKRKVGDYQYTVPSSTIYPHQWFWDSCFHTIIYTRLKKFEDARKEMRSMLQGQWKNGMIPHMIYWKKSRRANVDWGTKNNTSSITQPPMIAYAIENLYNRTNDKEFVEEVFDNLDRYYKWLHKERSTDYLLSIIHPWESGQDDFITWDEVLGITKPKKMQLFKIKLDLIKKFKAVNFDSKKFMKKNIFNARSLLFNCIYLRNLKSMHVLSKIVGKEEKYYANKIKQVTRACKKTLYDKEQGIYSTVYNKNSRANGFNNSSLFMPLFAGLLTKTQAEKLVKEHLQNKNLFWTKYPIPTISKDDKEFEPGRYWRGSSWLNINWFVYQGLKDYGFNSTAKKLRKRSIAVVKKSGFYEYFNPIDGSGGGPKDFCWSGLIFDMK